MDVLIHRTKHCERISKVYTICTQKSAEQANICFFANIFFFIFQRLFCNQHQLMSKAWFFFLFKNDLINSDMDRWNKSLNVADKKPHAINYAMMTDGKLVTKRGYINVCEYTAHSVHNTHCARPLQKQNKQSTVWAVDRWHRKSHTNSLHLSSSLSRCLCAHCEIAAWNEN